ncbi:MAG: peptidoglycan-associated lipoprotein Pal [Nitrospinota bacterium]
METIRMRRILWMGLILIVAVGFVGCRAAAPPPAAVPPPVTRVEPPPPPPPPEIGLREPGVGEVPMAPPIRAPEDIEFEFAGNIHKVFFEFDKSRLTDEAKITLQENAEWLRAHPDIRVQIEGHADERGTIEYNLALGERRAMSTRNYLASLGIDPARLFTISYGEERPAVLGHDEDAWAQNRRAEFKIAQ